MTTLVQRLLPAWWPDVRRSLRPDLEAGLISAVLILPQAFALATLAGMPPEYGIYASIFPVVIAAFFGSSHHALSGPNTAVCVLIAGSVAPLASPGNEDYIGLVLALTLMVGIVQFLLGLFRLGVVLDFISQTVVAAIVQAVALVIIVSAGSAFLGSLANLADPFYIKLWRLWLELPEANPWTMLVGAATVATGIAARRFLTKGWRRYALVCALLAGMALAQLLDLLFGPARTDIERVGHIVISPLPLSLPRMDVESLYIIKELVSSAIAIAFLGLMQTVVIARALADKSGQLIDTNREILGQGLSNLAAPFLSSFAGSGSFNRSAAHYEAGARTPMSALHASLFLAVMVMLGAPLIAWIPSAAVAGVLVLVGWGLVDWAGVRAMASTRHEAWIFAITFVSALLLGLNTGVFLGLALSLVVYLGFASTPNVHISRHIARDGRPVTMATIDGNLFFGSVRHVERALSQLGEAGERNIFLLRTNHLTYLDVPGATLLVNLARRRRARGDDVYIHVSRDAVIEVLQRSGLMAEFREDHILYRDVEHPMRQVIYPTTQHFHALNDPVQEESMQDIARKLRYSRHLGSLSLEQITPLLEQGGIVEAKAGDTLITTETSILYHLVLLEGCIEVQPAQGAGWSLDPAEDSQGIAILEAAPQLVAKAKTDVRYIPIDADAVDELAGWNQQFSEELERDPELARRMNLVRQVRLFNLLPLENVLEAFRRMTQQTAQAGETIITQGELGDRYFLMDSGKAEVIRTDPFTEETARVDVIGPGDAFGEESLVQGGYRNATIRMLTPGRLLVLKKEDFDTLLTPVVISEIAPEEALAKVQAGEAIWVDCRYDMEFEESRIPGALFCPLDQMRKRLQSLDLDTLHIVYCRSGRRSKAAAFILRERGIKALSLTGGIKNWPYDLDLTPMNVS